MGGVARSGAGTGGAPRGWARSEAVGAERDGWGYSWLAVQLRGWLRSCGRLQLLRRGDRRLPPSPPPAGWGTTVRCCACWTAWLGTWTARWAPPLCLVPACLSGWACLFGWASGRAWAMHACTQGTHRARLLPLQGMVSSAQRAVLHASPSPALAPRPPPKQIIKAQERARAESAPKPLNAAQQGEVDALRQQAKGG